VLIYRKNSFDLYIPVHISKF